MKNPAMTAKRRSVALRIAGITLGLTLLCWVQGRAETPGPVVGFVRLQLQPGPQLVKPSVQPFAPLTDEGETEAQMLSSYLGDDFLSSTNVNEADWIGFASTQDDAGGVTMIWRDQQGQWYDLNGNPLDPACDGVTALWFDLAFDAPETIQTRELVLSGQAVW